jgi:hypothetical protein
MADGRRQRAWRWRLLALMALGAMFAALAPPARAHGEAVDVVVEALARSGEQLGVVDYAISIAFIDGDAMTGAEVEVSVAPDDVADVDPVVETVPGVYVATGRFPGTGEWRVTVAFDSPDSSGSVEFTQVIGEPAVDGPLVMVDTARPDRVGKVADETSGILGASGDEVSVGNHRFPIVVEAFIETAANPLVLEYAATVDGVEDSSILMTAESDDGDVIEAVEMTSGDGLHRSTIAYPSAALWTVTMTIEHGSGEESLRFQENLPWPHYTTEAGRPKVKYDSERPDRIGTIVDPGSSIYLQGTSGDGSPPSTQATVDSPATTTPADPHHGTDESTAIEEVVVNISDPADELSVDIGLRVLHVAALGLWAIPLIASSLGRQHRLSVSSALSGMVLTVIAGLALALWGAPVTFPGLLRWEVLADRLYGDAYLVSFLVKMAMVTVAVVATIVWASRRNKLAVLIAFGGLGAALVAVIAMSQFHVFSHL